MAATGKQILHDAQKSLEIGAKLEHAQVFAVCADGSIYRLESMKVRPPITASVCDRQALLDLLKA